VELQGVFRKKLIDPILSIPLHHYARIEPSPQLHVIVDSPLNASPNLPQAEVMG
jgi:hypothetical protein